MADDAPLLKVRNLSKDYPAANGRSIRAVNNVSVTIDQGEVLGVVGESGCGKSTLGRSILRLIEPTEGKIEYAGRDLLTLDRNQMKSTRAEMQIIFQDPFGSLNPRHRVGSILAEPLKVHGVGTRAQQLQSVAEKLELVGLPLDSVKRYPHEFSGGQRQRIAIARALMLNPKFIIADEAVSALDVSIQSQIINLLSALQKQLGLTLLFISHDLSVIRHVSDRVAVMYLGRIVESGPIDDVLNSPQHPYTQALVSAVPHPGKRREQRIVLQGELPDPSNPPRGCHFNTRCPEINESVEAQCVSKLPELVARDTELTPQVKHKVACHLYPFSVN
ncbi:MAG: ATP-binding cassette domain-containing protein [Granulosicoccus sp.]|nr:ATP-binding cassette domain-containing protein [Granulosicoccus sp.]